MGVNARLAWPVYIALREGGADSPDIACLPRAPPVEHPALAGPSRRLDLDLQSLLSSWIDTVGGFLRQHLLPQEFDQEADVLKETPLVKRAGTVGDLPARAMCVPPNNAVTSITAR